MISQKQQIFSLYYLLMIPLHKMKPNNCVVRLHGITPPQFYFKAADLAKKFGKTQLRRGSEPCLYKVWEDYR